MALVSACGFSESRKFILINETSDIDGSFLISTLIGQRLRLQNSGIILVCCQQNLKHYEACGRKLGYNLSMSVNKNCLLLVEPLKNPTEQKILEKTFEEIDDKRKTLENDGKKNITIIVDDFSFFTNFGNTENELINIGLKLHELTNVNENVSVLLKIGLSDIYTHLSSNIEDYADAILTLERLKSGDFWDVDGKINIKKFTNQNSFAKIESDRTLLYFVGDHNVKLTAPGEFGLK